MPLRQVSVPFNFIPRSGSHQILFDLKESAEVMPWVIGLSDGTGTPSLDSNDDLVPQPSPLRTSIYFKGYVADLNIDIATNEIVRGTLTIQRSGSPVSYWNGSYSAP